MNLDGEARTYGKCQTLDTMGLVALQQTDCVALERRQEPWKVKSRNCAESHGFSAHKPEKRAIERDGSIKKEEIVAFLKRSKRTC